MSEISVIMLTYNREAFVQRAIKSILNQTFKDFEFIIVNNGSTDSSGDICERLALDDKRIRVIHRKKGNIGSGRNTGLNSATGKYITFIDDDDYCLPKFLEFLHNLASDHNADIAVCGSHMQERNKSFPNESYSYNDLYVMNAHQAIENYLWRRLYNCAMPTKLIRHNLFSNIRFPENGVYDDISTTYKYFANAAKVAAHGKPHYAFHRHEGNNSSAATKHHLLNPKQLNEYLKSFQERSEYISNLLPELAALSRYSEWSYLISMIEKIHRFRLKKCNVVEKYMKIQITDNLNEFLNGGFLMDFEKEWLNIYVLS